MHIEPGHPDTPANLVHRTGDETIAGQKTFTVAPKVVTPATLNNQLVRKDYVDAFWALTGNTAVYTPTWTSSGNPQPSLGNGSISGLYYIVRDMVWIDVDLLIGSTTTFGTGEWIFSPPTLAYSYIVTNPLPLGVAAVLDTSTTEYFCGWSYYGASTGGLGIYGLTAATNQPQVYRISNTRPIVWAPGDRVRISCRARINI